MSDQVWSPEGIQGGQRMADDLPWWGNLSVRLAKAVPGLAGLAQDAAERHRLSSLAHDLALLAFWQDGVLAPLKRMSERGTSPEDIAEIAAWQARTAEEVARASDRLRRARATLVATQFGMNLAQELDSVIWEKLGPGAIRPRLERIAANGQCSSQEAKGILQEIEAFNRHLVQVHEQIRPKQGSKRAPAKRARRPTTAKAQG